MVTKLLGILGGICFGYCGVPAAWASYKAKAPAAPLSVTAMIVLGGVSMFSYLFLTYGFDLLLTLNYGVEVASWVLILYYHVRRKL
jgi:lipid-A-disaccharide synthase-like uncharacterized protein